MQYANIIYISFYILLREVYGFDSLEVMYAKAKTSSSLANHDNHTLRSLHSFNSAE